MDQQNGFPGELPEIPTGLSAGELDLVPGEGFWARIEQIAVMGEMTRGLDSAMQGQSSPRIWVFFHEPGRGELSATVAMSFARELAFRDQAVLLLDCDDQDMALTRWAGRVEAEGWIDLARYGTSVLTSGVPMPFVGRRGYLLGVGSFAPTDVTSEEIDSLLTRLRRQADDLLLVVPADPVGRLWASAAAIRVFCWDRKTMSDEEAGAISAGFTEAGCPLTAVTTFQETGVAGALLVDEVISETESAPETPEPVAPSEPETEQPVAQDQPETETEVESVPESTEDADWQDLPLEKGDGPEEPEAEELEPEDPGPEKEDEEEPELERDPVPARETSRVFWVGAVVALALIAVATVYYFQFVRVPPEGPFGPINVVTETGSLDSGGEGMSSGTADRDEVPTSTVGADSLTDSAVGEDDTLGSLAVTGTERETVADSAASLEVATSEPVQADEIQQEEPVTRPSGFDMSPYLEPVGAKGWALHVYSLSNSQGTAKQVQELDRRGFQSKVKIFDLEEKGRWFRIYLGSFASRSDARQAMPALLEKLGEDWAKPERIETSAPE
jgi:septal ring-binding cell division protein DamX